MYMILMNKNRGLRSVTPWGGAVAPFYEVGRERSEPGNP